MAVTNKELAFALRKMERCHRSFTDEKLEKKGIHLSQLRILHSFGEDSYLSQVEISNRLNVSPPHIAMAIKKMVTAGQLEKVPQENDMRYNRIHLTATGKQLREDTFDMLHAMEDGLFVGFSQADKDLLFQFVNQISKNIKKSK
ncbi:MarR family winged helix-turn-helix transcriptional regulator [Isobaculum melis]|uniref:DNA-binding transcriptional regulator, MarR family n=1 Tax=Isobaculum melis TaxID=142588 RepID=A0A1H9QGF9_9LACT|nr:MarR family winged helix-turn-helix transcriptional regulator [Isobaculum melis]SER59490.1 DNA-binding transcriptional regulator, MarR family [Isobaculum melis]